MKRSLPFLCLAVLAISSSSSCGGGGGGGNGLQAPVQVPNGSGTTRINMSGTWEIRNALVIDSNAANPLVPLNGTPFVLDSTSIVSIFGSPLTQASLEAGFMAPLEWYTNQANGQTVLYGFGYDLRAQGGIRQNFGLAGGAVDQNTISIEAYQSTQAVGQAEMYTRSRYTLARLSAAILEPEAPSGEAAAAEASARLQAMLPRAFGGR